MTELFAHQITGAEFLAQRGFAFLWDEMGCVDGEAVVHVNRRSKGAKITLAALYRGWQQWDHAYPTKLRALCNGEFRQHQIVNVLDKGVMSVLKVILQSGKTIRVTPDHEFANPNNIWTPAYRTIPGDTILTNGTSVCLRCGHTEEVVTNKYREFPGYCRTCIYRYLRSDKWSGEGKHLDKDGYVRISGQWDHPRQHNGTVPEHILVMEKKLGRIIGLHEHVHHRNENKSDNDPANLEVLTYSKHHRRHHRHLNMNGGKGGKGGDVVFIPKNDKVVSVVADGVAHVYDVVMAGEHRNFVANGIVVHNCGKTVTSIVAAGKVSAQKILVVAPAVMRNTWANEFETWQTIKRPITIVDGFATEPPGDGVTIVSHATMADEPPSPNSKARRREQYGLPNLHRGAPYDLIILDESHAGFVDNTAARARNFYGAGDGLWTAATRVWAMTGTPQVNSAADFYPAVYGPLQQPIAWYDWCKEYTMMKPSFDGWKPTGVRNPDKLAAFLRPHVLRRTIDSLSIKLPPLTTRTTPISLPRAELDAIMQGLDPSDKFRIERAMENGKDLTDAAIAKVRHALGLAKVPAVLNHLLSGRVNFPVVIFFQHTDVRERIYQYLSEHHPNLPVSWIDGKITRNQLRAAKDWFQDGKLAVLLVQTQAGGVGLTLTRSHHCLIAELPWTSVARDQAIARLHRITQVQPVTAEIFQVQDCWLESLLSNVVAAKSLASNALLGLLTTSH